MNYLNKYKVNPNRLLKKKTRILLRHHRMPGDILTMTPLVRDLKKTYGDMVEIKVETPQGQDIWKYNPYLTNIEDFEPDETYNLDYKLACENEARGLNMAEGFRQDFIQKSGIHIIPSDMWPDIFLSEEEIEEFDEKYFVKNLRASKYWIICPGNKKSCQIKLWPQNYWEKFVVDGLLEEIRFIQIGQSKHGHEKLNIGDSDNFIDRTENLRDLFCLFYFARGSIGYHSFHMHIAAAFRKPCLVIAGGRESTSLFKYPNHIVYSSIGSLPCCQFGGCYGGKNKTVREICRDNCSISLENETIPQCMMNISLKRVIDDLIFIDKLIREETIKPYKYILSKEKRDDKQIKYRFRTPEEIAAYYRKNDDDNERGPIEVIKKPIFRMICNTHCFSGGERTAVRIMELMKKDGYSIELLSASNQYVHEEFKPYCQSNTKFLCQDIKPYKADIVFFQVNDSLIRIRKGMITEDYIRPWYIGERKILGINYNIIDVKNWIADLYICQSKNLVEVLSYILNGDKLVLLKPPADLYKYLSIRYNRDWSCPILIRHSSQGDRKYYDNMQEQIDHIFKIRPEIGIELMPAPSYIQDRRVQRYPFRALDPYRFLEFGNIFWYFVDPNKFVESGCNVVLEAMASGLPILCNNNGGLPDVVDDEVGWCCNSIDEMYDVIKNIDMKEGKKKGNTARLRVQKIVDPKLWVKYIKGEL